MNISLIRPLLWVCAALLAVVFLGALASAAHGSLELFPSPEQEDKVLLSSVLVACLAGALEAGVMYFLLAKRR